MTHDEIVKYTDHLLAEFYKDCPKQLNKENRQVDIVLTDGDFSTLQNMMCEAITNIQHQSVNKACEWLRKNTTWECNFYGGTNPNKNKIEDFRKAMEE